MSDSALRGAERRWGGTSAHSLARAIRVGFATGTLLPEATPPSHYALAVESEIICFLIMVLKMIPGPTLQSAFSIRVSKRVPRSFSFYPRKHLEHVNCERLSDMVFLTSLGQWPARFLLDLSRDLTVARRRGEGDAYPFGTVLRRRRSGTVYRFGVFFFQDVDGPK